MNKKKMNVMLALALTLTMAIGLAGCGPKDPEVTPPPEATPPIVEVSPETDVPEVTTPEVDVTEDTTPEVEATDGLMFANVVASLEALYGDNYLPGMEIDAEILNNMTGLTPDMYTEFYGAIPMISAHVDSIFMVKAAEGQKDAVVKAFTDYKTSLEKDSVQYPMNLPKIAASTVETYGDYVVFMMLGGYPDNEADEAATIEFCKAQTAAGLETIAPYFNGEVELKSKEELYAATEEIVPEMPIVPETNELNKDTVISPDANMNPNSFGNTPSSSGVVMPDSSDIAVMPALPQA